MQFNLSTLLKGIVIVAAVSAVVGTVRDRSRLKARAAELTAERNVLRNDLNALGESLKRFNAEKCLQEGYLKTRQESMLEQLLEKAEHSDNRIAQLGIEARVAVAVVANGGAVGFDEKNRIVRLSIPNGVTEHVQAVPSFAFLRELELTSCDLTEMDLAAIGKLRSLRRLILKNTPVIDSWLPRLFAMSNLEHLDLRGSAVTQAGINKLTAELPGLRTIEMESQ